MRPYSKTLMALTLLGSLAGSANQSFAAAASDCSCTKKCASKCETGKSKSCHCKCGCAEGKECKRKSA